MTKPLHFQPIKIEHRNIFQPYLTKGSRTCDRTFNNLFCWQHYYRTAWAESDGWLVVRAYINGERRAAYIVLSQDETPHYEEIIPTVEADAAAQGLTLSLMGLTEAECTLLQQQLPDTFIFDRNRDFADYVYRAEDLRTLKGRKFAQKRNHVNKFNSLYNFEYKSITQKNINDCLRLEEEWIAEHADDESAFAERIVIQQALQHFEELELIGGALYVDNQLIAFTYGSAVNETMFCTHVEKADIRYEGAYQMINQQFALHLPENYTLINREEDMGMAGLRKAKMSYEPVEMAYKTTALKLTDDMRDIVHVWRTCFGADDPSVYPFLARYHFGHCAMTEKVDGHIVAMAFTIPCQTAFGLGAYLYGVATLPEFRHQGISTRLVRNLLEHCRESGATFSFLIPSDEEVVAFYDQFGYKATDIQPIFHSDMDLGTGDTKKDRILILPLDKSFSVESLPETLDCTPML